MRIRWGWVARVMEWKRGGEGWKRCDWLREIDMERCLFGRDGNMVFALHFDRMYEIE